jgi:trimeric autotransporter adhesin
MVQRLQVLEPAVAQLRSTLQQRKLAEPSRAGASPQEPSRLGGIVSSTRTLNALARCISSLLEAQPDLFALQQTPDRRDIAIETCALSHAALQRAIAEETPRRAALHASYAAAVLSIRENLRSVLASQANLEAAHATHWNGVMAALGSARGVLQDAAATVDVASARAYASADAEEPSADMCRKAVASAQRAAQDAAAAVSAATAAQTELTSLLSRCSIDVKQDALRLSELLRSTFAAETAAATNGQSGASSVPRDGASPNKVLLSLISPAPTPSSSVESPSLQAQMRVAHAALEAAVSQPLVRVALRDAVVAVLTARAALALVSADESPNVALLPEARSRLELAVSSAKTAVDEAALSVSRLVREQDERPSTIAAAATALRAASADLERHTAAARAAGVGGADAVRSALAAASEAIKTATALLGQNPASAAAAAAQTVLVTDATNSAAMRVEGVAAATAIEVARRQDLAGARASVQPSLIQLAERVVAVGSTLAAEGFDRLNGLSEANDARRVLKEAKRLVARLSRSVADLDSAAAFEDGPLQTLMEEEGEGAAPVSQSSTELLALQAAAMRGVEAAEASITTVREAQRQHEAAVVAGYDTISLVAARMALLSGAVSGLPGLHTSTDEEKGAPTGSTASQGGAEVMRLVEAAKAALVFARQALRRTALTATSSPAAHGAPASSSPLSLQEMHAAVQAAISAVATAGERALDIGTGVRAGFHCHVTCSCLQKPPLTLIRRGPSK